MSKKKKIRILFITQDLNRTGSEMVLWYLLINLDPEKYEIAVFCIWKGELYDILPNHIEKHLMYRSSPHWSQRMKRRMVKLIGHHPFKYQLDQIQKSFKADVWYVNTIAVPQVFELDKPKGVKLITHVHELLYAFSSIKRETLKRIIEYSEICIGCSPEVCEKLSDLKPFGVELQNSFIDTATIYTDHSKIDAIKKKLCILPDDFVWVVSGGTKYMKGLDLVLPLLEQSKENVKILWLGSQLDNALEFYVRTVAEKRYPGRLLFTGAVSEDYYNYMSAADGFLLLSREESFSLVMLEAAYLGLPIVAFNIGLAGEFVKQDMGLVVENRDFNSLVEAMKIIQEKGGMNKSGLKEAALRYSAERQIPLYEKLLDRICND